MKKWAIVTVLLVIGVPLCAFEYLGEETVEVTPQYFLVYDFFYVNLNSPVDIFTLGLSIPDVYSLDSTNPEEIFENNTELSPALKSAMSRKQANVCVTIDEDGYVYVNILLPNGRYTTVVYY